MKKLLFIIAITLIGIIAFSGGFLALISWKSKADKNNIFVRFENNTKYNYESIQLGKRINKVSSYRQHRCDIDYPALKAGETSEYLATRGKFKGYSNLSLRCKEDKELFKNFRYSFFKKSNQAFQVQYHKFATLDQEFEHPYIDKTYKDKGFPDGYYTFTISINKSTGKPTIAIQKDK